MIDLDLFRSKFKNYKKHTIPKQISFKKLYVIVKVNKKIITFLAAYAAAANSHMRKRVVNEKKDKP